MFMADMFMADMISPSAAGQKSNFFITKKNHEKKV